MKLILTADVTGLGGPGDSVEVKDGYGRNYLLPRGLAISASKGAERQVESIRRSQESRRIRDLDHAREVKGVIEKLDSVQLPKRTSQGSGKLFGSVTPGEVATALRSAGGPLLDKRSIQLPGHIKSTGGHTVTVRLHPDVSASFRLEILGEHA